MYDDGQGVAQNDAEAANWYRKAAEQGHVHAQVLLGVMYGKGQGVAQDYAEAVNWCRKAAEQGDANAQYNLGLNYFYGLGVEKNYVTACMWSILAISQLDPAAPENPDFTKFRNMVRAHLSRFQIAEAKRLAQEWRIINDLKGEIHGILSQS
jgi:TPR repeat protein